MSFLNNVYLGLQDNFTGWKDLILHPIQTAGNIWSAMTHPKRTLTAIGQATLENPVRVLTNIVAGNLEGALISQVSRLLLASQELSKAATVAEYIASPFYAEELALDATSFINMAGQTAVQAAGMCSASGVCHVASNTSLFLSAGAATASTAAVTIAASKEKQPTDATAADTSNRGKIKF